MYSETTNWPEVLLGELFEISHNTVFPACSPKQQYVYFSIPAWDKYKGPEFKIGANIGSTKIAIQQPTILVSKLNPRISRVIYIRSLKDLPYCASTEFISYIAKNSEVWPLFYKWFFQGAKFQRSLEMISTGSTNSHTRARPAETLVWKVPFPHVKFQKLVAEVLDLVDETIANTEAIIGKLKQVQAGMLQDLLTRGLDKHGQLRDPFSNPEKFKESPLGRIPKDWTVYSIGSVCSIIKDGTHLPPQRVQEGPLLLGVQNMVGNCLKRTNSDTRVSWEFFNEMHRNWQITSGDVMLAIVGATIGKVAKVPDDFEPFTIQRSVAILRGIDNVLDNDFLEVSLRGQHFQTLIKNSSNQTAQPGLYLNQIAALQLPLPGVPEQRLIAEKAKALEKRVWTERAYLEKLKYLKSGLMEDLLTGHFHIPETIEGGGD